MEEDRSQLKKRGNFLFRQELKNLTLEPTPICSLICNLVVGILLIAVMIPLKNSSEDFKHYRVEYTDCNLNPEKDCIKEIEVEEDLIGTVMVFYEIENFYINHKEFVRSKVFSQLRNQEASDKFYLCEGAQYMHQIKDDGNYTTFTGQPLTNMSLAYPCGLFAKYRFNDSFTLYDPNNSEILINQKNISYFEHKEKLFKNNEEAGKKQWLDIEDEHFIVWMTPEVDHQFIKIWGRIQDKAITKGKYKVKIDNSKFFNLEWMVSNGQTKKYFKLTNTVKYGSDKIFPLILVVFGGISLFFALIMGVIYCLKKNEEFDSSKMVW